MAQHPPSLKQASITPLPLPSTQFCSQNNMLDPATKLLNSHVSMSDHLGRGLSDSYDGCGSRLQKTAQNYANYRGLNSMEERFGAETSVVEDHDSGVSTPPLWRSTSPSGTAPHRQSINYRCLSPSSKAEAIARGQRELMEMVSRMPEACYELSLKDLVEHQPVAVESKQESFAEGRGVINEEKENQKKKMQNNPKPQINRSGSIDNGAFLLKMVFPISLRYKKKKKSKKKKKNDYDTNHDCKVSPKPSISDASGKSVDKEWWKKKSGSSKSESGGSTINSGSTKSSRSSSISSSSSSSGSCRSICNSSRRHMRGGCLAFFLTMKGKASR